MNFSLFVFLFVAFSTISRILATVESPYVFVALMVIGDSILTTPDKILSSTVADLGNDSPVIEEVLIIVFPSTISPSSGTISPGLTMNKSPIFAFDGSTVSSFPSINNLT